MAGRFIYKQIATELREGIEQGKYKPGEKLPSARELATEYNTSQITANKALNVLVKEGRIRRATGSGSIVRQQGETQGSHANISKNSHLIGVIVFDISHPFWAGTIRGIEEECRRNGYSLLVGNDEGSLVKAESYIRNFIIRGVEGLIFVPIGTKDQASYEAENRRLIQEIERVKLPYVLLHRCLETYVAPYAQIENYRSAYEATRFLLKQGIANPICISHYFSEVVLERERGFLDALTDAGFENLENRVYHLHPLGQTVDIRELHEVLAIMEKNPQIDGIFTIAADMQSVVIQAMKQSETWEDVKIVSFDFDRSLFSHKNIIAMIETPSVEMGMQSANILFGKILRKNMYHLQSDICPVFHIKRHVQGLLDGMGYLSDLRASIHE